MAAIENIVAWAKREQARLMQRLQQLQSGQLHVVEKHAQAQGWLEIDATAQSIELCREYLSELSAIIALYPEAVPTEPVAPPTQRFVPPVPQETASVPPPRAGQGLMHGLLHAGTAQHADWVVGWGVVKGRPPRWVFLGIYETHAEANEAAAEAGEGYYARWGSYNPGSKEFTSGPSFDRADTL